MYIILEYYLMENFIINYLILYITRIVTKTRGSSRKIFLGAFLSALYSLVFFIPDLLFLSRPYMKIIISIIIIKISMDSKNNKIFFYQLLGFYSVSYILAGLISSLSWSSYSLDGLLLNKVSLVNIFKSKHLVLGVILGGIISYKVFNFNFRVNIKDDYIIECEIYYNSRSIKSLGLVDTGNSLVEPISSKPVIIMEYDILRDLLPRSFQNAYENFSQGPSYPIDDYWDQLTKEIDLRPIAFKSLGQEDGIILGFSPDFIIINTGKGKILREGILVGIYRGKLSGDMNYNGLLSHEILIGGDYIEKNKA